MDTNKFIEITNDNTIQLIDTKRGNMPFYTLSQVASLLKEDEQQIRYYTNIFDDILNIDIVDKQFVYTDSNLDKLEFLIKLKNKGMTIKQITDYCDKVSLDTTETLIKECNTTSIDDFINIITKIQCENFNNLKESLSKQIESCLENSLTLITNKLIEDQNAQIQKLENNIYNYIDNHFQTQSQLLNHKKDDSFLIDKCRTIIDEKSKLLKDEMNTKTELFVQEFKNTNTYNNNYIVSEIKKIKDLIYKAYSVESEVKIEEKERNTIFKKFFSIFL